MRWVNARYQCEGCPVVQLDHVAGSSDSQHGRVQRRHGHIEYVGAASIACARCGECVEKVPNLPWDPVVQHKGAATRGSIIK